MSLGESVSSGPFFKAYVANLLPGQFIQPFVDAAFSDLGLDPQRAAAVRADRPADRAARDPAVAGALPAHRPRRRAASHICPTRSPATPAIRSVRPACRCPARGCYPYREPLPAPPPGGPPPGPPAPAAVRPAVHTGADARAGVRARTR